MAGISSVFKLTSEDSAQKAKELWRSFSECNDSTRIFQRGYWLDIVAHNTWDVLLFYSNSELKGALPFSWSIKFGIPIVKPPILTQYMFHWSDVPRGKFTKQLSAEKEILENLYGRLFNKFPISIFHIPEEKRYNLPLHWLGAVESTRYHYVLSKESIKSCKVEFSEGLRNDIKRAERFLSIRLDSNSENLSNVIADTFSRQNIKSPYSSQLLKQLHKILSDRGECLIFTAISNTDNSVHGSCLFCWDSYSVYYVCGGSAKKYRGSGANSLLVMYGIRLAEEKNLAFDFLGSQIPGIEKFFRSFGARPVMYSRISKFPIPKFLI